MLVDFLVVWLEEGAGGFSWRRVWRGSVVLVFWLRFGGEVWFGVCLFVLVGLVWMADWFWIGRWIGRWIGLNRWINESQPSSLVRSVSFVCFVCLFLPLSFPLLSSSLLHLLPYSWFLIPHSQAPSSKRIRTYYTFKVILAECIRQFHSQFDLVCTFNQKKNEYQVKSSQVISANVR